MKLSTKGRYATRALLDLALHGDHGLVLAKDISGRIGVSESYLEQLFIPLKTAGLVRAVRGARGGFALARPASEINLSHIIQATEGSVAPADCVDDASMCSRSSQCVTRDVWAEMKSAMDNILGNTTLQNLVDRHETLGKDAGKCRK